MNKTNREELQAQQEQAKAELKARLQRDKEIQAELDKAQPIVQTREEMDRAWEVKVPDKKKRGLMTIADTKLGITLVLSKEDCNQIGLEQNLLTKEAIHIVRARLGLANKW